jgi:hypothetical protein
MADPNQILDVHDYNPTVSTGGQAFGRGTVNGEQYVQPVDARALAIAGRLATFSNPTPGTAITSQASITAFDATKDVLHIFNGETAKLLIIWYIKMFESVAPGGSGTQKYEFRTDTQTGLTSGGTALTVKRRNLLRSSLFGNMVVTAGAMTTVAGSANVEKTWSGQMRNGVGAAGDEFMFTFNDGVMDVNGYLDPATTVSQQKTLRHGAWIIPPLGAGRMSHYGASLSTAGQYEWEIGAEYRDMQP